MNSGYSEPPDIVNFLPGPFEFTIMRVHCIIAVYCTDGEVRLGEGETAWEGRVELCLNGRWGTVGGNEWNQFNSHIVCNSLGYEFTGKLRRYN